MSGVLVLGASGFLGRHVVEHLLSEERYWPVTCVTRSRAAELQESAERGRWIELDAVHRSAADLGDLFAEVDPHAVVNCIGAIHAAEEELFDVNVHFVSDLVRALVEHGSSSLVHLGSAAEYGRQPRGVAICESATPRPVTDYGQSKLSGTAIVCRAAGVGALSARVLRIFNPLGSRSPESSVVGALALGIRNSLERGDEVVDVGDLGDFRDFVDARDVARAVGAAALSQGDGSTILNIGRGEAVQVRLLAARLASIGRFSGELREVAPAGPASRVAWQQADISRARAELGWAPRYSLDEAVGALWSESDRERSPAH